MSKKAGVGTIKGVGEKTEKLFEKIGVYTVDDLIHYYPRGYEIFGEPVPISEVEEGKVCTNWQRNIRCRSYVPSVLRMNLWRI